MNRKANQFRLARCRTVLLVAVVMGGTVPLARADCGDYVVIGNPLRTTQEQGAAESAAGLPMEHTAPQPCHGPGCQRRDLFPPVPVPAAATSSPEFAAILPAGNAAVTASGESRIDTRVSQRVQGVFDRVERPPCGPSRTVSGSWRITA